MIVVLDASAAIDLLLNQKTRAAPIREFLAQAAAICAPHLLDVEVAQVLRRFCLAGQITTARANAALADLNDLRIERYPHGPLLPTAFRLRANATMYDAVYLVLAQALCATLLTCDQGMKAVPGAKAKVHLVK